jgi:hypothetical protein
MNEPETHVKVIAPGRSHKYRVNLGYTQKINYGEHYQSLG